MKVTIKADFYEAYDAVIEFDYPKQIEVIIDVLIYDYLTPVPENTVRFFVTSQPEGVYNDIIKAHPEAYNYLLTPFDDLLQLPNSHLFVGCGSWLKPDPDIKKKFAVSTIMSGRKCLPGHDLRRELFWRRNEIKIPLDFYLGTVHKLPEEFYTFGCPVLAWGADEKKRTMDCQYHIAIDSYKRKNHYSEKLIDCFLTKTIPIYWGCTNIEEYFNPKGIIQVDSVQEIINYCNAFCREEWPYPEAIEENYQLAQEEMTFGDMLKRAILKIL
jgi:hypothetical protein